MVYKTGDIVEGKVTGIQPYGAFVALDDHISGLIHISEISDGYVRDISHYAKVGDTVRVKIIDFDAGAGQARLSLKALHRSRASSQHHFKKQKASLPPDKIGFSSIAEHMEEWLTEAEKEMNSEKRG